MQYRVPRGGGVEDRLAQARKLYAIEWLHSRRKRKGEEGGIAKEKIQGRGRLSIPWVLGLEVPTRLTGLYGSQAAKPFLKKA